MHLIDLQNRATPREGTIGFYWFENEHIGLKRTRFHRVQVEFEPFDTGCDYIQQPESPQLTVEWIELDIEDPGSLAGVDIYSKSQKSMEASIYIGAAHNPIDVKRMHFKEIETDRYQVQATMTVDFEFEVVAANEDLNLTIVARYIGESW